MVCWNKKWLLVLERSQEEQGDILPPSLPPCSNSGEQMPGMKELESQPFLVQLITMNNTILIISYCSLQVLKVLCNGSMEEGSVGPLWDGEQRQLWAAQGSPWLFAEHSRN